MLSILVHILAGLLSSLASKVKKILTIVGFIGFLIYEFTEWYLFHDTLYTEIREFMIGFFIGVVILIYLNRKTLKVKIGKLLRSNV